MYYQVKRKRKEKGKSFPLCGRHNFFITRAWEEEIEEKECDRVGEGDVRMYAQCTVTSSAAVKSGAKVSAATLIIGSKGLEYCVRLRSWHWKMKYRSANATGQEVMRMFE